MQHDLKAKSLTGFLVAFIIVFLWYELPSSLSFEFNGDLATHQFDRCDDLD